MTETLVRRLAHWAAERPDAVAVTELRYPPAGSTDPRRAADGTDYRAHTLDYATLLAHATALARELRSRTAPGARIALLTGHGLGYVVAFTGCLAAGRTAVPLSPVGRHPDRLATVLADAAPALALVDPGDDATAGWARSHVPDVLAVDLEKPVGAPDLDLAPPADPAYLQYTSGSTSTPAGVEVGHANLAAAIEQLRAAIPAARTDPVAGWLPYFHDMGLVLTLALPLWSGVPAITLAPADFVKRPIRWLRACADFRAGVTGAPDFALALTLSAVTPAQVAELELGALRALLNGAEPVRAATLRAFSATFAPAGFRHAAHSPGYGLAEATLTVTVTPQHREPVVREFDRAALAANRAVPAGAGPAVPMVGCGPPAGQRVRVVDPVSGVPLPPGRVGELVVSGPNVCRGYAGARPPAVDAGKWLHTGDLGFELDGEFFVSGRLKDLVVVAGRNHHPADVEATALACAPELRHVAVFGHDDGVREALVVVAEAGAGDIAELPSRLRAGILRAHDVVPEDVLVVAAGSLPRTSSGKIRRAECRARYAAGEFRPAGAG